MKPNLLFLTCGSEKEADNISKTLLEKRLIVCAKKSQVSSCYLFKGKIKSAEEILLIMDSLEENFDVIEKEIKKIHSYKIPVLQSFIVSKTTNSVIQWIKKEL